MNYQHQQKSTQKLNAPKQRQGAFYEKMALHFLQQQGLTLITQNWQQPKVGEIDLIMNHQDCFGENVVFIEVRQRSSGLYGDAIASITKQKQQKIIRTAQFFLAKHPQYQHHGYRFDVVTFDKNSSNALLNSLNDFSPQWIQNAFWIE